MHLPRLLLQIVLLDIGTEAMETVLTPHAMSQSGASITINPQNAWIADSEFVVEVQSQDAYDIKVALDSSWGFPSEVSSIFSLSVDGRTVNPNDDGDLLVVFSVNDLQYTSFFLHLDTRIIKNRISPCIAVSNTTQAVSDWISDASMTQRWDRVSNNDSWIVLSQWQDQALWPLQFVLTNHPTQQHAAFEFYHGAAASLGARYSLSGAFETNQAMDVYIMGDSVNEQFAVSSFGVSLANQPTNPPTPEPTNRPSPMPSNFPTPEPTIKPSSPTSSPSQHPSMFPSAQPSEPTSTPTQHPSQSARHPTTEEPSKTPTRNPTPDPTPKPTRYVSDNPTTSPIVATRFPSGIPTLTPTGLREAQPLPLTQRPTYYQEYFPIESTSPSTSKTERPTVMMPALIPTKKPTYVHRESSEGSDSSDSSSESSDSSDDDSSEDVDVRLGAIDRAFNVSNHTFMVMATENNSAPLIHYVAVRSHTTIGSLFLLKTVLIGAAFTGLIGVCCMIKQCKQKRAKAKYKRKLSQDRRKRKSSMEQHISSMYHMQLKEGCADTTPLEDDESTALDISL